MNPTQLVKYQKKARVDWSKDMLQKYDGGALKHIHDIVTVDESWIYAYELVRKQPSAKSNKSCSRTKHFQANYRMFFLKNWTCRNRTTRIMQNSQF